MMLHVAEKKVVDVTSNVVHLLQANEAQYSRDINALKCNGKKRSIATNRF